ncbi:MAG: glycosyltransferase [bacterium]|nr:glycosyltransferase [bacterium]
MSNFSLTCLIPFYNESTRCLAVLRELKKIPQIDHFLCVDDGSTDDTVALVCSAFPDVAILSMAKNTGKSAAVQAGLQKITTTHTLLFDADLREFSIAEIQDGIRLMRKDQDIDLIFFQQKNDPLLSKLLRSDILLSGERIGKTKLLQKACAQKMSGYLLELAINEYFFSPEYVVRFVPFHSRNHLKLQKWPVAVAIKKMLELQQLLLSRQFWAQRGHLKQMK